MVKAYLRYEQIAGFGVIASATTAVHPLPNALNHPLVVTAGVDTLLVWNLRKGEAVVRFGNVETRKAGAITAIAVSPGGETLAAGYSDGSIRLWEFDGKRLSTANAFDDEEPQPLITFNGHRSGVSCLSFAKAEGVRPERLVSGSNDGDLIMWNTMEEVGLYRIAAHDDAVTTVLFLELEEVYVISASKDGLVKVYEVATQHCVQTIVGHGAEVWAMGLDPSGSLLITGSVDAEIRAYLVDKSSRGGDEDGGEGVLYGKKGAKFEREKVFRSLGSVQRFKAADRVMSIAFGAQSGEMFVAVTSADKSAEVFRIRSVEDAKSHTVRRKKRLRTSREKEIRDKAEENGLDAKATEEKVKEGVKEIEVELEAKDFLVSTRKLRLSGKPRSISFLRSEAQIPVARSKGVELQLLLQMKANALEVHKAVIMSKKSAKKRKKAQQVGDGDDESDEEDAELLEKILTLDFAGHRDDIRSVSLAPDDTTVLSASRNYMKLWNIATQKCIRSMPIGGYGLCTSLIGADASRGVVGLKEGSISVFDLGSGSLVAQVEEAHKGPVWDMCLDDHIYDADTLITCGADKRICFWNIENVLVGSSGKLVLKRTLEMPDEVLCVRVAYGRDRPVVVASLMDTTVRAYFLDNLEPYLNFYGHRLPVMSMDVSSDGLILATGSADKTIKLWGMDFGDCRRSLRAHNDSVLSVAFQPKTHYLFSGSRDGVLKYWDGDKFEFICELDGQRGEVWSLDLSSDGEILISASHDRMMRVWRKTDEPLFLEEEQDKRMDEMFESTLIDEDLKAATKERRTKGFLLDESKGEASAAGKRSLDTIKGGERLLEALELCEEEVQRRTEESDDAPNPLLLGLSPEAYMLRTLEQIKTPDLEQALHILPLDAAIRVLQYCCQLLDPRNKSTRLSTEMLSRAAMYLTRLHHSQITAGAVSRKLISDLHERMQKRLAETRATMGFNCAALHFCKTELTERDDAPFRDASARAFNIHKRVTAKAKKARVGRRSTVQVPE